jgi:hypothetical protein
VVIPHHVQWRTVEYATQRWAAASTILERPEFGPKVKFAVRDRASVEARTAWLATDPPISDGDYLLEALRIAQHPRGGSAAIHLLGKRPSLVRTVFEYQLEPLYPAAARHTASLDEHVLLVEALGRMDEGPVRNWAADVFDGRTDGSWIFRQRIRKSIRRTASPGHRVRHRGVGCHSVRRGRCPLWCVVHTPERRLSDPQSGRSDPRGGGRVAGPGCGCCRVDGKSNRGHHAVSGPRRWGRRCDPGPDRVVDRDHRTAAGTDVGRRDVAGSEEGSLGQTNIDGRRTIHRRHRHFSRLSRLA